MNDHAPPGQTQPLGAAVAVRAPDPEYDRLARLGEWLAAAEGKPGDRQAGMAAALRLFYTRELQLPPFAVAELSIIAGRLVVSADLLRALAQKAGYQVVRVEQSPTHCVAAVLDAATGEELGRAAFSIQDAQQAGLIKDKSAWKTYPQRMLWHRAAKYAITDTIPAVALGLLTEDEAVEIAGPIRVGQVEPERVEPSASEPRPTPDAVEPEPEPGPPLPPPPDTFSSFEAEQEWRRAQAADELRRAHRDLALLIRDIETEGREPPPGHASWTEYTRHLAREAWGVESRSELDAAQVQSLIEETDRTAGASL